MAASSTQPSFCLSWRGNMVDNGLCFSCWASDAMPLLLLLLLL